MAFWKRIKASLVKWLPLKKDKHENLEFEQEESEKNSPEHISKQVKDQAKDTPLSNPTLLLTQEDEPLPYKIISRYEDSKYWGWVERIRGKQELLKPEKFILQVEQKDEEIIRFFESAQPPSYDVLLHCLPASKPSKENPILLVHGAGHNANQAWCQSFNEEDGLLQTLSSAGKEVYAVTFAHPHGDNWMQAVQLSNVIKRIKEQTNKQKITVIAHSKGGIPAWIYLSDLTNSFGAPYEGEVETYIMLGTPNKGLDFPFRHVSPNWSVLEMDISAPIACDSLLHYGIYINTTNYTLYKDGGAFPGSAQLLYRWDDKYPVQQQAKTIYDGGQNIILHSRGIDAAIREGGCLIEKLLSSPIHKTISVHVLAGNNPYINGFAIENDVENDGLLFVDSVLYTEGIAPFANQVKRKDVLPLNHLELLYEDDAHQWILDGL
ncbi:esterase/lipase family protein [Bacillus taeanensis]|uniref:Acetyltransferase n=1 Tax=Bacillus taeanensis TaxID=273032 RepID=A0A366XN86_9BACI|nr:alpha/beta fold hydrolase [Bacillus taeanensis]RBW67810.1 acetyltransferase [Bacillus taeanensis]